MSDTRRASELAPAEFWAGIVDKLGLLLESGQGGQATASIARRLVEARRELDKLRVVEAVGCPVCGELDDLTDEQLVALHAESIAELPDHLAEELLEQLAARLGPARVAEIVSPTPTLVHPGREH